MRYLCVASFLWLLLLCSGCYSLKGVSIAPEVKSFTLAQFQNAAGSAPPSLAQEFGEKLKLKVIQNTRLIYTSSGGHLEFSGTITGYRISTLAPNASSVSALGRLEITVEVDCKNTLNKDTKEDWHQSFSRFADYSADTNFSSVEQSLSAEITKLLIEDIFNKAFTNW